MVVKVVEGGLTSNVSDGGESGFTSSASDGGESGRWSTAKVRNPPLIRKPENGEKCRTKTGR